MVPSITVKAVESYEYTVCFDYELTQKRNFTTSVIDSDNNVSKARVERANGTMSNFSVMLYANKSYNNNILEYNPYISFTEFNIEVNTTYPNITISLEDEDHNPVYETTENYLYVYDLIDQKYYVTIKCEDSYSETTNKVFINNVLTVSFSFFLDTVNPTGKIYNENGSEITSARTNSNYITFNAFDDYSGIKEIYYIYENNNEVLYSLDTKLYNEGLYKFYCIDNAGNSSNYYTVSVDKTKPNLIVENAVTYSDTNVSFTVSAVDNNTVYLYYKTPIMSVYSLTVNNKITITETMPKGKYYFYAIDNYNNKTSEVWINYGGENSIIKINHIENTNSVFLTWESSDLKVQVNNKAYTKENIISDEGLYEITVIDSDNNTSKLYFEIVCYFIKDGIVESNCMNEGYTIYRCISCGSLKYDNYTLKGSHNYNHYKLEPTCNNSGGIYYYCIHCNYNYIISNIPPLGHNLKYQIIDSSCEKIGYRMIECECCDYYVEEEIPIKNHKLVLLDTYEENNKIINQYMCEHCMQIIEKDEENKNQLFINFVFFLQNKYFPYIVWILLLTVSIWSIIIGTRIIFLKQRDEQFATKNMIKNYIFGIIAIFVLIVCIPLLIQGLSLI